MMKFEITAITPERDAETRFVVEVEDEFELDELDEKMALDGYELLTATEVD
jgi:hypothetical protein